MTTEASGSPGAQTGRPPRREQPVDLYELLEVSRHASPQVIRAAYRTLARTTHPDANPEGVDAASEQRMRQLNAAYRILSDARSRARYDHELLTARRAERVTGHAAQPGRVRLSPARSQRTSREDRLPAVRAGTVLVLLTVAAVVLLLLVLVTSAIDPSH